MPQRDYDDLDFPKVEESGKGSYIFIDFLFITLITLLHKPVHSNFGSIVKMNKEGSWQNYLKLCEAGGSLSFTNLIKLAGLRSPFVDGCLEDVVSKIKNWLDNIDLKKL